MQYQNNILLGQTLVNKGIITNAQLEQALVEQRKTGQMLGKALLHLGFISDENIYLSALAEHLAIDFINANGVNGEKNVAEFEALPEFQWLLRNAGKFGFVLSYPKNAGFGITYEPWHWHYDGTQTLPRP